MAVQYIAMHWSASKCRMSELRRGLPWRTKVTGVRPGVTGEGAMGPESDDKKHQWHFPRVCLTDLEKRKRG